jgi:spore germination cell wall hydrolase CwlJ-like protein
MTPAMCLAIAMFFEARDQSNDGMKAVGEVVVNRVEHDRFPDTICAVVFEGCKFSFNCDGLPEDMYAFKQPDDVVAREVVLQLSEEIMDGEDRLLAERVTFYHTTDVSPYWSRHKDFTFEGQIGDHIFYSCVNYC